ncbi:hypothetical protein [Streptomyces sp. NPDC051665]|uniref:hypothetical protein n=1 Tax=Streptomyces sp. NPDC051665 TaxID=3154647 RepID=UPI003434111B
MSEDGIPRLMQLATAEALIVHSRIKPNEGGQISVKFGDKLKEAQEFIDKVDGLYETYDSYDETN